MKHKAEENRPIGRAKREKDPKWRNVPIPDALHAALREQATAQGISIALFVRRKLEAVVTLPVKTA